MKIVGLFRGFPGLGRVVSGVELLTYYMNNFNAEVYIYTYLQGDVYIQQKGFDSSVNVTSFDYSSLGIIPVSKYGEKILKEIGLLNPDLVLVDGEPLMIEAIKISYPNIKVLSLLNPSDVENHFNPVSSSLYFSHLYSLSDAVIVHGTRKVLNPGKFNNFFSINTILRREILEISPNINNRNIYCVLGGGTVNVDDEFINTTLKIAELCIGLAMELYDYEINLLASCQNVYDKIIEKTSNKQVANLRIWNTISSPSDYYSKAALIITRAGRNSLSELLYLGIPAISFISGCSYRRFEQSFNSEDIKNSPIVNLDTNINDSEFILISRSLLSQSSLDIDYSDFSPGNSEAIRIIDQILNNELLSC